MSHTGVNPNLNLLQLNRFILISCAESIQVLPDNFFPYINQLQGSVLDMEADSYLTAAIFPKWHGPTPRRTPVTVALAY